MVLFHLYRFSSLGECRFFHRQLKEVITYSNFSHFEAMLEAPKIIKI